MGYKEKFSGKWTANENNTYVAFILKNQETIS
jgi:hypothetical protein